MEQRVTTFDAPLADPARNGSTGFPERKLG